MRCIVQAHRCARHVRAFTWLYRCCTGCMCSYGFTYRNTWKSVCRAYAGHTRFWTACGAVRVVRVNIDAMVFSAVWSGHSSPRLQGVFVFSWQLLLWRGPAESAPAAQPPSSKAGLEAALSLCNFSHRATCPACLLLHT